MKLSQKIAIGIIFSFYMAGGIGHFVDDEFFIRIVPPYLPYPEALVYISGVFEILGAIGLLVASTRRWASYGLIALAICVFPANLYMAMHPELFTDLFVQWHGEQFIQENPDFPALMLQWVRPPLQLVIISLTWWAGRPIKPLHD